MRIKDIKLLDEVTLDSNANHPYAGKTGTVTTISARENQRVVEFGVRFGKGKDIVSERVLPGQIVSHNRRRMENYLIH